MKVPPKPWRCPWHARRSVLKKVERGKVISERQKEGSQPSAVGNDQAQIETMFEGFGPRGQQHVSSRGRSLWIY
jgi:hypothetical protein